MTTIEITDIADVQDGDIVTLRWREEPGITVTLEGPAQDSTVGDFRITRGRFVSATRELTEWEPGTVYEITTLNGDTERAWYLKRGLVVGSAFVTREGDEFTVEELASIQPVDDDAEALRAEVQRLEAEVERLCAARTVPSYAEIEDAISQGFELDCNLTFEGGVPKGVVGRVMAAIYEARGRASE